MIKRNGVSGTIAVCYDHLPTVPAQRLNLRIEGQSKYESAKCESADKTARPQLLDTELIPRERVEWELKSKIIYLL